MRSLTAELVGADANADANAVRAAAAAKLGLPADSPTIEAFAWVGKSINFSSVFVIFET